MGRSFSESAPIPAATAPLVVALAGDLGAGKTTLAQAICAGYGVTEPVTSPTFALVHRYDAPRSPVYHLDLYRLDRPSDLINIGWDEIVASHALIPDAQYHAFSTFGVLMSPDLPLERRHHEMIATMVSVTNRCRY